MTLHVNQSGTWKQPAPYVNQSGTWKQPAEIWVNQSGTWKRVYPIYTPSLYAATSSGVLHRINPATMSRTGLRTGMGSINALGVDTANNLIYTFGPSYIRKISLTTWGQVGYFSLGSTYGEALEGTFGNGNIYAYTATNKLIRLNPSNMAVATERSWTDTKHMMFCSYDGHLYTCGTYFGRIYEVNPTTLDSIDYVSVYTSSSTTSYKLHIGTDGYLYTAWLYSSLNSQGGITRVNRSSMSRTAYETLGNVTIYDIVQYGSYCFYAQDKTVRKVSTSNLSSVVDTYSSSYTMQRLEVDAGGYLYASGSNGYIYKLNSSNLNLVSSYSGLSGTTIQALLYI